MAEFKHKENSGSLFRNDKKESEKHPDYKGSAIINGVEYWLSSWINETNGKKYMAIKFQAKDERTETHKAEPVSEPNPGDGLPF